MCGPSMSITMCDGIVIFLTHEVGVWRGAFIPAAGRAHWPKWEHLAGFRGNGARLITLAMPPPLPQCARLCRLGSSSCVATSPGSTTRTVTGPELRSTKVRRGAKSCACFSFVDVPGGIWVRSLRPMAREGGKMWPFSHGAASGGPTHPPAPPSGGFGRGPNFGPGCQVTCPPGCGLAGVVWGVNAVRFLWSLPGLCRRFGAPSAVLAL